MGISWGKVTKMEGYYAIAIVPSGVIEIHE